MNEQQINSNFIQPMPAKKGNSKNIIIIGAIVIVIAVIGVILFLMLNKNSTNNEGSSGVSSYETTFVLESKDGYTLFDTNGKKVSDEYKKIGSYSTDGINNLYVIKDNDNNTGVIDANGKVILDLGDYSSISSGAGLYLVTTVDKDYNRTRVLKNAKNKVIATLDEDDDWSSMNSAHGLFSVLTTKDKVKILDRNGNEMLGFKRVEDKKVIFNNYYEITGVIHYNGENHLINFTTGKPVLKLESTYSYYPIPIDIEANDYVLTEGVDSIKDLGNSLVFIKGGKVVFDVKNETCNKIFGKKTNGKYHISCETQYGNSFEYVMNEETGEVVGTTNEGQFFTGKNYAKKANDELTFYKNGQKVTSLRCQGIEEGHIYGEYYLTYRSYNSTTCQKETGMKSFSEYSYYDVDGNLVSKIPYKSASNFISSKVAIVSEDKESYYLINDKFEKISDDYEDIKFRNFISAYKADRYYMLDSNGEVLFTSLERASLTTILGEEYVEYLNLEGKHVLYNKTTGKEIYNSDVDFEIKDYYFITKENNKTQYYSYLTGKMFHEK